MGSIVFNPSTQQPESVSVKTGAYTIPAGYYAYVTAHCDSTDTFSIGGVVALQGNGATAQSLTTAAVSAVSQFATGAVSYTVPSGYYFQGQGYISGTTIDGTLSIGGITTGRPCNAATTGGNLVTWNVYAGSGDVVGVGSSGDTCVLTGVSIRPFSITTLSLQATNVSGSFWVAQNTTLTTSGGRYTVSLYKNIA